MNAKDLLNQCTRADKLWFLDWLLELVISEGVTLTIDELRLIREARQSVALARAA